MLIESELFKASKGNIVNVAAEVPMAAVATETLLG